MALHGWFSQFGNIDPGDERYYKSSYGWRKTKGLSLRDYATIVEIANKGWNPQLSARENYEALAPTAIARGVPAGAIESMARWYDQVITTEKPEAFYAVPDAKRASEIEKSIGTDAYDEEAQIELHDYYDASVQANEAMDSDPVSAITDEWKSEIDRALAPDVPRSEWSSARSIPQGDATEAEWNALISDINSPYYTGDEKTQRELRAAYEAHIDAGLTAKEPAEPEASAPEPQAAPAEPSQSSALDNLHVSADGGSDGS